MRVIYCNDSNNNYDSLLINSINDDRQSLLSSLSSDNNDNINEVYDFMVVDSVKLMALLLQYCEGLDNSDNMIIIINITNTMLIEDIGQLLRLPVINRRPKIILISSLLTWDGNSRSSVITNYTNEFLKRTPNSSYINEYKAENCLWNMANLSKCEVIIVGTGLMYGGSGYDYSNIMNAVFEDIPCSLLSTQTGKNRIPSIHYNDFSNLIINLIKVSVIDNTSMSYAMYIAATDGNKQSLSDIISSISTQPINEVNESQIIDGFMENKNNMIWSMDLSGPDIPSELTVNFNYINGLNKKFQEIWTEYLSAKNMLPCSIFIAGGPRNGKTEIAKALSSKLQLEYIDVKGCVQFILNLELPLAPEEGVEAPPLLPEIVLRTQLAAALEAKEAEGKKAPKKGEVEVPFDPLTVELTDTLLSAVSAEIVRKCVATNCRLSKVCKQKGFVIDVWQSAVVQNMDDIVELLSSERNGALYEKKTVDESAESPVVEEGKEGEIPIVTEVPKKILENLIELNCSDAKVTQRDLERLGVPEGGLAKASKDQQAAVKNFEASLVAYASKMKPIPLPEDSTETSVMTHEVIMSIEASSLCNTTHLNVTEITVDDAVEAIVQSVLLVHGPIGWMSVTSSAEISPSVETVAEVVTDKNNNNTITISDNDDDEYMKLNNGIMSVLNDAEKELLMSKTDELQKFLGATVLPHVAQGLINIARERPDDPIMYLADYLDSQAKLLESNSEEAAKIEFDLLLKEALNLTI